jgi:hypothetical protein
MPSYFERGCGALGEMEGGEGRWRFGSWELGVGSWELGVGGLEGIGCSWGGCGIWDGMGWDFVWVCTRSSLMQSVFLVKVDIALS